MARPFVASTPKVALLVTALPRPGRVCAKSAVCRPKPKGYAKRQGQSRQPCCRCSEETPSNSIGFDERGYVRATVDQVLISSKEGPTVYLKLSMDGLVLPIFIGELEAAGLMRELHSQTRVRPMTHDLFKSALEVTGHKVFLARLHMLVGSTYHARLHIGKADGTGVIYDLDARPSDAINLAVRFAVPLLVARDIAVKMGIAPADAREAHYTAGLPESQAEIVRACRREVALTPDPTIMMGLTLQMAIKEERYEEASKLRDDIERVRQNDRALGLIVAIEAALEDGRYQEAARLREKLQAVRKSSPTLHSTRLPGSA